MNTCSYGAGNCSPSTDPSTTSTTVLVPSAPHPATSGLPFTGGDVVGLSFIGIGAIVIGSLLVRTRRRFGDAG